MTNSEFKKAAKQHQVNYREQNIGSDYNTYVTWLTDDAGKSGKNFFDGFSVFNEVQKRYPKFFVDLYSDTLRSEHIPFNLFVPFRHDLTFCKNVFNELLGGCIKSVDRQSILVNGDNIIIEFAPSPKKNYLDDRTSFDTYIEYTHQDDTKGIIGIEVKYTEREYPLIKYHTNTGTEKKELTKAWIDVENYKNQKSDSIYLNVTKKCKLYKEPHHMDLIKDDFRQLWRNHILGESILITDQDKFKHFTSLTLFPEGNEHFTETSEKYIEMLLDNDNKFVPVTYEKFLSACYKYCPNNEFKIWIDYLTKRYIIQND